MPKIAMGEELESHFTVEKMKRTFQDFAGRDAHKASRVTVYCVGKNALLAHMNVEPYVWMMASLVLVKSRESLIMLLGLLLICLRSDLLAPLIQCLI